jgi:hypothetical protein
MYFLEFCEEGYVRNNSDYKERVEDLLNVQVSMSKDFVERLYGISKELNFSYEQDIRFYTRIRFYLSDYMRNSRRTKFLPRISEQKKINEKLKRHILSIEEILTSEQNFLLNSRLCFALDHKIELSSEGELEELYEKAFVNGDDKAVDEFYKVALDIGFGTSLKTLLFELAKLKSACEYFDEHEYERLKIASKYRTLGMGEYSPKQRLCIDIATYMSTILGIAPTKYYSSDHDDSQGLYAKILTICFLEADKKVPADLKRYIIWACDEIGTFSTDK